jgi:hypothetical protein
MPSGTLYRVVLDRTDVSEKVLSPFSGLLTMIGFHGSVSVVSLLISLSIEGKYLWPRNTVLWDFLSHVRMILDVAELFVGNFNAGCWTQTNNKQTPWP